MERYIQATVNQINALIKAISSKEEDQENEEESKEATEPRTSMKKGKGQYSELLSLGAKIFMNVRIP